MKWIDRAVDYVANRVLDRMEERRPAPVNNITVNNSRAKDPLLTGLVKGLTDLPWGKP